MTFLIVPLTLTTLCVSGHQTGKVLSTGMSIILPVHRSPFEVQTILVTTFTAMCQRAVIFTCARVRTPNLFTISTVAIRTFMAGAITTNFKVIQAKGTVTGFPQA